MSKNVKGVIKPVLRTCIGLCILLFLINQIPLREIIKHLGNMNVLSLFLGTGCFLGIILVQALRHHVLLKDFTGAYWVTLKLVLIGFFYNHLLPTHVAGDAYKIYYLKKRKASLGEAFALITLDRLTALAVMFFSGLVFIGFAFDDYSEIFRESELTIGLDFQTIVAIVLIIFAVMLSVAILCKKSVNVFRRMKAGLSDGRSALGRISRSQYASIILLSCITFALRVLKFYFFILCFTETISVSNLVIVVLLANLVPLIPVSVGGLGVLEGTLFMGLTFFHISETAALSVALLNRAAAWLLSVSGAVLYLEETRRTKGKSGTPSVADEMGSKHYARG